MSGRCLQKWMSPVSVLAGALMACATADTASKRNRQPESPDTAARQLLQEAEASVEGPTGMEESTASTASPRC